MDQLFNQSPLIPEKEPSADLLAKVMFQIETKRQRVVLRQRITIFSFLALTSGTLIIPAWQYFRLEALQSGFSQYLSFAAYDVSGAVTYWQELGLSLLESIPTLSLAAVLAVGFVLWVSVKSLLTYRKAIQQLSSQLN
jgi:hypothetical protein